FKQSIRRSCFWREAITEVQTMFRSSESDQKDGKEPSYRVSNGDELETPAIIQTNTQPTFN
ncbi:hypothetical protein BaRGS_00000976, partial [Batillaria attramentaria]